MNWNWKLNTLTRIIGLPTYYENTIEHEQEQQTNYYDREHSFTRGQKTTSYLWRIIIIY